MFWNLAKLQVAYLLLQTYMWPWKVPIMNVFDQLVSCGGKFQGQVFPLRKKVPRCVAMVVATQILFIFTPKIGEDSHVDYSDIFQTGWNHQQV